MRQLFSKKKSFKERQIRVVMLSQYFWPEDFRINELTSSLSDRGIEMTVLTGKPNYPGGNVFKGYKAVGCLRETMGKVQVFRVPMVPRGKQNAFRLALNYLSFMISGALFGPYMLRNAHPDVIFVYCPSPLLQALPALFIGWIKRVPVVTYVQDLWPESIEATGYVRSAWISKLVEVAVKFIYRRSDLVLVSSRPFIDSIRRHAPAARVAYYPNSVEATFCNPDSGSKPHVSALDAKFCVVFAGNVGAAQAVHVIVDTAVHLKSHSGIRLVILGSGSKVEWMREHIAKHGLCNLHLAGRFPARSMPFLLSRASVLLASLADRPIFAATVPNKIQAYMAVGRPIIASMNGEGGRLVLEAEAGLSVPAEDSKALADAILKLYEMSQSERERMGANAQNYYRKHFNHESLVTDLIEHLTDTIKAKT